MSARIEIISNFSTKDARAMGGFGDDVSVQFTSAAEVVGSGGELRVAVGGDRGRGAGVEMAGVSLRG